MGDKPDRLFQCPSAEMSQAPGQPRNFAGERGQKKCRKKGKRPSPLTFNGLRESLRPSSAIYATNGTEATAGKINHTSLRPIVWREPWSGRDSMLGNKAFRRLFRRQRRGAISRLGSLGRIWLLHTH
jgi:hypothetical protein